MCSSFYALPRQIPGDSRSGASRASIAVSPVLSITKARYGIPSNEKDREWIMEEIPGALWQPQDRLLPDRHDLKK